MKIKNKIWRGGGRVGFGGGSGLSQVRCERRSEVFVKISHFFIFFFFSGSGLGGGGGVTVDVNEN